mmetsp:Transcript_8635/g.35985  ORF Transcript_8635/g.35985 Transcript_8635/m.35985 type:complete len:83 (-) Transcript_8635:1195-1443(-)
MGIDSATLMDTSEEAADDGLSASEEGERGDIGDSAGDCAGDALGEWAGDWATGEYSGSGGPLYVKKSPQEKESIEVKAWYSK